MTDPNEPTKFSITDMFNSDDEPPEDFGDPNDGAANFDAYDGPGGGSGNGGGNGGGYDDGYSDDPGEDPGDDSGDGRYRAAGGLGGGAIAALIAAGLVIIGLSWWGGRATASPGSATDHTVTQSGAATGGATVTQNQTVTSTVHADSDAEIVTQTLVVRPPARTVTRIGAAATVTKTVIRSAPAGGTTTVTAPAQTVTVTKPGPATTVTVTKTLIQPPRPRM